MGGGVPAGAVHRARTLAGISIYNVADLTLTGDGPPERIPIVSATPSLASVLRISPAVGRWLSEKDGLPGAPQVAVISHGLWTRRYSGDRNIIGRLITLGGVASEVVGVMPAGYAFPDKRVDAWTAMQLARSQGFGFFGRMSVARLRQGAGVADVQRELSGLIGDLPQAFPGDIQAAGNGREINLFPIVKTLKEATVGGVVRDKDGITAALVVAELAASLKSEGRTLLDRLCEFDEQYGRRRNLPR